MKDKIKIKTVRPNIELFTCDDSYDLAMHFLRVQEYYESPNPKFKSNIFSIIDYMEWYSKEFSKDKSFTYAADWSGFNVPSHVLKAVYETEAHKIPDINKYDRIMYSICNHLFHKYGTKDFYLIGAQSDDEETIKHEIAHGFWFTNPKYRIDMENLVSDLDPYAKHAMIEWLLDNNYCQDVLNDETQAYLATGLTDSMKKEFKKEGVDIKVVRKPFIKLFDKYYNL